MDVIEAMNMLRRLESLPEIYRDEDVAVINTVHAYFAELHTIELRDKAYYESGIEDDDYLGVAVEQKKQVHLKYWSNRSSFYMPCSIADSLHYDWAQISQVEIFRNGDDDNPLFIFSAKYPHDWGGLSARVYMLRVLDGRLCIEHEFM